MTLWLRQLERLLGLTKARKTRTKEEKEKKKESRKHASSELEKKGVTSTLR